MGITGSPPREERGATEVKIRRVDAEGLPAALDLAWRVFLEFEAPEYAKEGVAEFQKFIRAEHIAERMHTGGMVLWGWYEGNAVIGMIAITETGHINLLFVDPAYHRRGIARALHQTAMDHFRQKGVAEITVNSSPYAVEVYRRFGFVPTDAERTVSGIRFTPMLLKLSGPPAD